MAGRYSCDCMLRSDDIALSRHSDLTAVERSFRTRVFVYAGWRFAGLLFSLRIHSDHPRWCQETSFVLHVLSYSPRFLRSFLLVLLRSSRNLRFSWSR